MKKNSSKKPIIITAVITALVMFIVMCMLIPVNYQGRTAQYWNEQYITTEAMRSADYTAIMCVRGLGYTNFPNLNWYYTMNGLTSIDSAGNYYSKGQVDQCLFGI